MTTPPPHIVIAGGGVAAIEAVAALRSLAGPPTAHHRAHADPGVAAATGCGRRAVRVRDAERAAVRRRSSARLPFDVHVGTLALVQPEAPPRHRRRRRASWSTTRCCSPSARKPLPAVPGAITFGGPADVAAVERVAGRDGADRLRRAAGLGLGAAGVRARDHGRHRAAQPRARARDHGRDAGVRSAGRVRGGGRRGDQRAARRTGDRAAHARAGSSRPPTASSPWRASRTCSPTGSSRCRGSPGRRRRAATGPRRILPVDEHARVRGVGGVYAAGDATTFALKQGGLATQQADAAAETIAADLGARGASRRRSDPSCVGSCSPAASRCTCGRGSPGARAAAATSRRVSRLARCGRRRARSRGATSRRCWPPRGRRPGRARCRTQDRREDRGGGEEEGG